jgi:hypothetical protein
MAFVRVEGMSAVRQWGESRAGGGDNKSDERKNKLKFWNRVRREVITGTMSVPCRGLKAWLKNRVMVNPLREASCILTVMTC